MPTALCGANHRGRSTIKSPRRRDATPTHQMINYPPPKMHSAKWPNTVLAIATAVIVATIPTDALAFTHVVKPGETIASIAERFYGGIHYERILVYANALDACGGFPIVPGMRLEIPSVTHHRVMVGDTWQTLAREYLGDSRRGEVLARANGTKSWLQPADGTDIVVPYNLRFLVQQRETAPSIAKRFFSDQDSAWLLDRYNGVDGKALRQGDVVLVPLTELPLTEEGKKQARESDAMVRAEGGGAAREAQRVVAADMPQLLGELRGGNYVAASVRGNRMLAQ
ncbi:MAG: LysM peptidoglycan-binding domain-containing protein, partial [Polyangiaceae bacterium]|nr:LysM peptidoglycan-binding domain-containing protein [Polyangiaceae bacterium]